MSAMAAITVHGSPEEVEQRWRSADHPFTSDAQVTFKRAPGDRGTEIHVTIESDGPLAKLFGSNPLPKVKDELRRFKQKVETGVIARSDATPAGEAAEAKLKQRPAQPLDDRERQEVGV